MSTGAGLNIKVNDAAVLAVLNQLAQSCTDLQPALEAIGATLESNIRQRFELKRDPNRAAWQAHRPSTAKQYQRQDTNKHGKVVRRGTLLQRSGQMLNSLSHQNDGQSVTIGFGVRYAQYHEFGTRKMVRRGMLMGEPSAGLLGADDEVDVLAILNTLLEQAMQG